MKGELISVIVPVHNGQDYLEKCIDSIENQTYENLEILVVNDGSTDRTGEICACLQEKYGNLQVFTLADVGVSAARNYAMDRAKGEYITFVDADDRLCPGTLAYLYERIEATGSDLAGCRFAVFGTEDAWQGVLQNAGKEPMDRRILDGKPADGRMPGKAADSKTEAQRVREACYDRHQYLTESILKDNCRCWSKLYRRKLIDRVRFREGLTVGEDMLFLVDILPYIEKAVETDYPGYGYYQNPGGVMKRPFTPSYMDQIRCWEIAQELILQMDGALKPRTAGKIITSVMLAVGKIAMCSGKERREAGEYLVKSREILKEQLQVPGSISYLPEGYGIKVKMFRYLPGVYVRLYHGLQSLKAVIKGS